MMDVAGSNVEILTFWPPQAENLYALLTCIVHPDGAIISLPSYKKLHNIIRRHLK